MGGRRLEKVITEYCKSIVTPGKDWSGRLWKRSRWSKYRQNGGRGSRGFPASGRGWCRWFWRRRWSPPDPKLPIQSHLQHRQQECDSSGSIVLIQTHRRLTGEDDSCSGAPAREFVQPFDWVKKKKKLWKMSFFNEINSKILTDKVGISHLRLDLHQFCWNDRRPLVWNRLENTEFLSYDELVEFDEWPPELRQSKEPLNQSNGREIALNSSLTNRHERDPRVTRW